MSAGADGCSSSAYLIDCICFVVVDDSDFTRVGKLNHLCVLNVNDILDRQRYLNAVSVVMASEDDPL